MIALGAIVAYPYIPGSSSDAFKGVSLFIGVVLSLGSTSAMPISSRGYMMTYRRAFRISDRVKIGDATGDVTEMRLQVTHLRSFKKQGDHHPQLSDLDERRRQLQFYSANGGADSAHWRSGSATRRRGARSKRCC